MTRAPSSPSIGDGALTGGMAWEALNNIAAAQDRPVVIVVNDNGRSYSPTIGGVADALATLRLRPGYEDALNAVRQALHRAPVVGTALYDALHAIKKGLKDVLSPQGMFEDLGLKYVGPVDGHDIEAMESALRRARSFGGPVIVHAVTTKGFGYPPAETDQIDAWHATGVFDPDSGASSAAARDGPTPSPTSSCGSAPSAPTSSRSPRRCCTRPAWPPSPSGSPSGPSTSASPSSTRSPRPPAWRWPGCTRRRDLLDLPQPGVRPAPHGRRPAPPAGDRRARPRRA